ncbi:MAG TPA: galactose-1-phosphate uridylyltransferase [Bryobacteraceae bacterium]|nr:galactose-1-phosphate uridylyltransferase [Bryobacteraceae bacterium]
MSDIRKDPVTGRWVIISGKRAARPGDFTRTRDLPKPNGRCPFCYGHEADTPPEILSYRENGNGHWNLRVVPNKFSALRVEGMLDREGEGLYDRMSGVGAHEVIIESPDHEMSLAGLPEKRVEDLFWAFRDRIVDLKRDSRLRYVLLFKNHGEEAGASLEHTHSQIIALPVVPIQVQEELEGAQRYYSFKERCVFCDIVRQESANDARVILETDQLLVISPYAPRFPFETWVLPRSHNSHFETAEPSLIQSLAWAMRAIIRKMEKVLEYPAYNFLIHTAPVQAPPLDHYHWHLEIIPRLARVAGFEWGAGFYVNPTPPEESAQFLRDSGL